MVGPFGLHPNKTMRSRAFMLAKPLASRGYQVKIFMPPWQTPQEADKSWQEDEVEFRYIPLRGGVLGITRKLIGELLDWQPDVVHSFKPKAFSGLVMWWLWQFHRHRLRLILDTDDWEGWGGWNDRANYSPWQKRFFAWQERWGLSHCHTITAASRTLQSLAWSQGIKPERVVYLPNGPGISQISDIDQEIASRVGKQPVLLLYSRFFEFETDRLVAILRKVKTAIPDLIVLSVGSGLYEEEALLYRQQLIENDLIDMILDVGWVTEDRIPGLLAAADIGIYLMEDTLLNRTKCPVKLADILYAGVPVVAEAVGQVSEYVLHNQTGLLKASGDVEGISADLIYLLINKKEQERLAAGAKTHIKKHFDWAQLSLRLEKVYLGEDA